MTTPDALFEAIFRGDADRVKAILDAAPELVNVRDGNGDAPIHAAVSLLDVALVRLLVEKGARTDARDGEGRTPAELAAGEETAGASDPPDPDRLRKRETVVDLLGRPGLPF